ncbi:MAG: flavodoxin domain-containing protein [Erythrobacter sp.]
MVDFLPLGIGIERWLVAGAVLLGWMAASARWLRRDEAGAGQTAEIVIAHASQTGTATSLAGLMKEKVAESGRDAVLVPLAAAGAEQLSAARQVVIVAATTGAGEAPDCAHHVERTLLARPIALTGRQVFVLALGDRTYEHFCAFGYRVKAWAEKSGAEVAIVAVDNRSASDLERWDELMRAHGLPQIAREEERLVSEWIIAARREVAEGDTRPIRGSRSGPLLHLELVPGSGEMPDYAVGDLFEWHGPGGVRRDFSIASLPGDRSLELIVRRVELPGGGLGRASSVLTAEDGPIRVRGRIRSFPSFHETAGSGPLLAIAAGSGWGGIRPHVLAAAAAGRPVWLVYGERGGEDEPAILAELRKLHGQGRIARLDLALSRVATGSPSYVQDVVETCRSEAAAYLGTDGAVAICGAAAMGAAVEELLAGALPPSWIERARAAGRWRSALY